MAGDNVTLFVNTKAATFHVEAYRMGYYQGIGGRLVWTVGGAGAGSGSRPPSSSRPPTPSSATGPRRLTFTVDRTWPPGAYLLKLVGVHR